VIEMLEHESARLVELSAVEPGDYTSDTIVNLVEAVNEYAESDITRIEEFHGESTPLENTEQVKNILSGKIESLRKSGSEENFAEFERRLVLASIDELWMQHIDRMAHLREEVAFE
jgi:preprotein translocase subunit SecA